MKRLLIALTATALTVGGALVATPALAASTTPTPTASATATPTPTASATAAPTATATPTPSATATPTPTVTPSIAVTDTISGSASNLTAALTGVPAGSAVVLQRAKGSSTTWVDLETAVSDAKGSVTFAGVHSNHSQLFRVVSGTVVSNVVAVKQYALSPVSLSLNITRSGDYLRATGTASYTSIWIDNGAQFVDTIGGHRVHLQRWTTKWKDADIIRSKADGGLSDKVKYEAKHMFRFASVATASYQTAASVSVIK